MNSVSKKWLPPFFRGSKFGQPEVARICKELILQAKSTTQQGGVLQKATSAARPFRKQIKRKTAA